MERNKFARKCLQLKLVQRDVAWHLNFCPTQQQVVDVDSV